MNFIRVNAQERYYEQTCRSHRAGSANVRLSARNSSEYFEEEAKKIGSCRLPCPGNNLSGCGRERSWRRIRSDQISPQRRRTSRSFVDFKEIIEPLRDLFKDEVRQARTGAWNYLRSWYSVSRSRDQGLEFVSSAKSLLKRYALSRMQTASTANEVDKAAEAV